MDVPNLMAIELGLDPAPEWYIPPKVARWHPGHIRRRAEMCARRWERIMFTPLELERICDAPCSENADEELLMVANDWIRTLQRLSAKELRLPDHRIDEYCGWYEFSKLLTMVDQLHDRIFKYTRGVPRFRQNPEHHRTTHPGIPESDVAQARQIMVNLLQTSFGTWIEDIWMGGWLHAYPGAPYTSFSYSVQTNTLQYIDQDADDVGPREVKLVLDMVFNDQNPTENNFVVDEDFEPRSVFMWILGIPDEVTLSSDGVMEEQEIADYNESPDITSDMKLSIELDFNDNDTIGSRDPVPTTTDSDEQADVD